MLIDSHAHLNFEGLIEDIDSVLERAKQEGVEYILNACSYLKEADEILSLTKKFDNIYASIGVHPFDAQKDDDISKEKIISYIEKSDKVLAVGECGLDYFYDDCDKARQKEVFQMQIDIALEKNLPLMVHSRSADEDIIPMLTTFAKKGGRAVIHCFTGNKDVAKTYLDLGFYLSASGIVTFKKATELQEAFKIIPLDRLLVETDAPYLAPTPFRGKLCEPSYVKHTAQFLADLKGVSIEDIAKNTTKNFKDLYKVDIKV